MRHPALSRHPGYLPFSYYLLSLVRAAPILLRCEEVSLTFPDSKARKRIIRQTSLTILGNPETSIDQCPGVKCSKLFRKLSDNLLIDEFSLSEIERGLLSTF